MDLPHEVLLKLLAALPVADLGRVEQTCRLLRALSHENLVWRAKARERWSSAPPSASAATGVVGAFRRPVHHLRSWRRYFHYKTLLHAPGALEWHKMEREEESVQARCAHTGCVVGDRVYFIGGQDSRDRRLGEIHCYDPRHNKWEALEVPQVPNFARHQAVAVDDRIFCFGGYDLERFYELAMFVPATGSWTYPEVTGDRPPPRSNHASAVIGTRFYIFGGSVGDNVNRYETVNDFYCCDVATFRWTKLEAKNAPSNRVGHKMIAVCGKIYLFGGGVWSSQHGWTEQYNETWLYSPEENEWTEVKVAVRPPVCTYTYIFSFGTHIAVYGGASITGHSVQKELWLFDTIAQTWDKMEVAGEEEPSSRSMGSSDRVGNSVFFWGGYSGGVLPFANDFYRLDISRAIDLAQPLFRDTDHHGSP